MEQEVLVQQVNKYTAMKTYRFEYTETNTGYIEVKADNEAEAFELAQCGDGAVTINKCDWEIGERMK